MTAWRCGSRKDTVARVKSSSPANKTNPIGKIALSCQLTRTELKGDSSFCDDSADLKWPFLPCLRGAAVA
jgi:hypothetical protein